MMVDCNANTGRWPFRKYALEEAEAYAARAKAIGITQAWMGNLEGVFHQDLRGVNQRLVKTCAQVKTINLLPAGSINPMLPDWEEDLRQCKQLGIRIIRLHPNYHGYRLEEDAFTNYFNKAAEMGFLTQIVLRMEDERTQHPLMRVPPVDLKPLPGVLAKNEKGKAQILNGMQEMRGELGQGLSRTDRVFFDWAMLEGAGVLEKAVELLGPKSLTLGSHAPLFPLESAILKMKESGLKEETLGHLRAGNAIALLPN